MAPTIYGSGAWQVSCRHAHFVQIYLRLGKNGLPLCSGVLNENCVLPHSPSLGWVQALVGGWCPRPWCHLVRAWSACVSEGRVALAALLVLTTGAQNSRPFPLPLAFPFPCSLRPTHPTGQSHQAQPPLLFFDALVFAGGAVHRETIMGGGW